MELGPHAQAYLDTHEALQELRAADQSEQLVLEGIMVATELLAELRDTAAADFAAVLEAPPPEELLAERATVEALRGTKAYKLGMIGEDKIEARLARIDSKIADDPTRAVASAFMIAHTAGRVPFIDEIDETPGAAVNERTEEPVSLHVPEPHPVTAAASVPEVVAPPVDGDPSNPEMLKPDVSIVVYKKDNMLIVNGKDAVPLARAGDVSSTDVATELFIEATRLRSLEFLAANRGKKFRASEIWQATMPADRPFDSKYWNYFIGNFLRDELKANGMPLVTFDKPTPRLWEYSISSSVEFNYLDEDSGIYQATMFKFPNGKLLAGDVGCLMQLLKYSSKSKPVRQAHLVNWGIVTRADIKARPYSLSNLASRARRDIPEEMAEMFIIHIVQVAKRGRKGEKETAYYLERRDVPEDELPKVTDVVSVETVVASTSESLGLSKPKEVLTEEKTLPEPVLPVLPAAPDRFPAPPPRLSEDDMIVLMAEGSLPPVRSHYDATVALNVIVSADTRAILRDFLAPSLTDSLLMRLREKAEAILPPESFSLAVQARQTGRGHLTRTTRARQVTGAQTEPMVSRPGGEEAR